MKMTWKLRKSLIAATLASAIAVLAIACGSDPDTGPAASADTPVPATAVPASGSVSSTAIPRPDNLPPLDLTVGEQNGIVSYLDLARALEAAGVESAESDMLFPPNVFGEFGVSGRDIIVGGDEDSLVSAIVFEFIDISSRGEAQLTIDLDLGVVGNVSLGDFDRVAFFASGNLILMYVGNDLDTIDLLSSILGEPIASTSDDSVADPTASIRKLVDAPIQSVELIIMESDPVQITALIVAGLPNGCYEAAGVVTHIAGNIFGVTVQNSVPALDGVACTDDFRTYEETVRLGSGIDNTRFPFQNDVTYTLVVNDHVIEFTNNGVQDDAATLSGYDALRLAFAEQGVTTQVSEEVFSGVLGIEAGIIKIGDADVQVHEFGSDALASGAASGVSDTGSTIKLPDGSVSSVLWIAPPHFFLIENVIALYTGDDAAVLSALLAIAGDSFAGGPIDQSKPEPEPTVSPDDGPGPFPIPTQRAPIESVEIGFLESFPVQHLLQIVAGLENGCIEPYGSQSVTTSGVDGKNIVEVEVTNVVGPPGTACDASYRTYEENINLGSDFESGSEWDVYVNGKFQISFTAE
jgi:hypothetical protein